MDQPLATIKVEFEDLSDNMKSNINLLMISFIIWFILTNIMLFSQILYFSYSNIKNLNNKNNVLQHYEHVL